MGTPKEFPLHPRGKAGEGLDPFAQLLAAARRAGGDAGTAPPAKLREGIARLIKMSLARDPRGARLRIAWREIASAVLEILQDLSQEPGGE